MNCEICPYEERIKRLESQSDKSVEENRNMRESIFNTERTILEMQGDIRLVNNNISNLLDLFKPMQDDIKVLKEKPYQRYDKISMSVTMTVISLVIGAIFKFIVK